MDIDCVIIGVNAAATLRGCLDSVLAAEYSRGKVTIYYVDGGSSDGSLEIARGFEGVQVIELHPQFPTPGMQRNAGWRAGTAPLVQFLDSDTTLSPQWWERAVSHLRGEILAVRGRREEIHPEASRFNAIADMEWNPRPGNCDAFGGDVLISRMALEENEGYDEGLVGFEDRELSYRITHGGHLILHLDASMTKHDLAMTEATQYWKRAYRTGYGFAAVAARHRKDERGFWIGELQRIAIRGGGALALIVLSLLWAVWTVVGLILLLPAAILLFYPRIFGVHKLAEERQVTPSRAARYAWHCSFVVVPQFFGAVRFFIGRLFRWPLRYNPEKLHTGVTKRSH